MHAPFLKLNYLVNVSQKPEKSNLFQKINYKFVETKAIILEFCYDARDFYHNIIRLPLKCFLLFPYIFFPLK